MIEFEGYLTGSALKTYLDRSRKLGQKIILVSLLLILPAVISIAVTIGSAMVVVLYCSLFVIFPLLFRIPKGKKEEKSITPKRIYTDGEYIICVADKFTESRLISEVSKVLAYDEYYVLVFPFGRVSDKFICQKQLLTKGTVAEFEALFCGKIVRC